jgi:hypothetical protein
MYKDRFEKNSIVVEAEIDEKEGNTIIKIETTVKDKELLPALNVGDKQVMNRVFDAIVNQQFMILNTREFWLNAPKNPRQNKLKITCQRCNNQFEWPEPCCGEKEFTTVCPYCGLERKWTKDKNTRNKTRAKK